eukprot:2663184-Rhodomonas_salina.1
MRVLYVVRGTELAHGAIGWHMRPVRVLFRGTELAHGAVRCALSRSSSLATNSYPPPFLYLPPSLAFPLPPPLPISTKTRDVLLSLSQYTRTLHPRPLPVACPSFRSFSPPIVREIWLVSATFCRNLICYLAFGSDVRFCCCQDGAKMLSEARLTPASALVYFDAFFLPVIGAFWRSGLESGL